MGLSIESDLRGGEMEKKRIWSSYKGNEPYVFISYSHRDRLEAEGIIEQLQNEGYRIWYDDGIDPGTEWDENIATHIEKCGYFIALLSENYLNSSNCKDELNYARELEKSRLLIYLSNVQLPGWMIMRLSRLQAIHKYKYQSETDFFDKLRETNGLGECRDTVKLVSGKNHVGIIYTPDCPKADVRLLLAVDTSGSMAGKRIALMNKSIERMFNTIKLKYGEKVGVDVLKFDTSAEWVTINDLPITASGLTNYSTALELMLNYGNAIPEDSCCSIIFTTDGFPTDHYRDVLHQLRNERWFSLAIKLALTIGDSTSLDDVTEVVGSENAVVNVEEDMMCDVIENYALCSIASSFLCKTGCTAIYGRNICEWNDDGRFEEPMSWTFSEDGTLRLRGCIIPDFYRPNPEVPWKKHRNFIKKVVVTQGVRIIGMHSFFDLPNLEAVEISHTVTDIRSGAFANCPKLDSVTMGRNIYSINAYPETRLAPRNCVVLWPRAFENTPYSIVESCELTTN